jgi:hypothetical protein
VCPWGGSASGKDMSCGGCEAVVESCKGSGSGEGRTDFVMELEARGPLDVMEAGDVVGLTAFAQIAARGVGAPSLAAM